MKAILLREGLKNTNNELRKPLNKKVEIDVSKL
jgi:hypothetical protein